MTAGHGTAVAVVQMEAGTGQLARTLARAVEWMQLAREQGAALVVVPQLSTAAGAVADIRDFGHAVAVLGDAARHLGLHVVAGLAALRADGRKENRAVYIDAGGVVRATHAQVHYPWRYTDCAPGDRFQVVATPAGILGLMVGEDLLYPESARTLRALGAEIIACPFTTADTLLNRIRLSQLAAPLPVAHAGANEVDFLFASAVGRIREDPVGETTGLPLVGHSQLVSLSGGQVAGLGSEPGILIGQVNPARIHHWRFLSRRYESRCPLAYTMGNVGTP